MLRGQNARLLNDIYLRQAASLLDDDDRRLVAIKCIVAHRCFRGRGSDESGLVPPLRPRVEDARSDDDESVSNLVENASAPAFVCKDGAG